MKRQHLLIVIGLFVVISSLFLYNRSQVLQRAATVMQSPVALNSTYAESAAAEISIAPLTMEASAGGIGGGGQQALVAQPMAGQIAPTGIQRRVIGRAALELVVEDSEAVVSQINQLMTEIGGYVANANLYRQANNGAERLQGTLTLRVPADQMDAALAQLEAMGLAARSKSINREDVTDQYSDIDAQLRNLNATENELRELLAEVRKKPNARPDDILTVHRTMTDIRSQIEQLQGRKNMLDNLIGMSTIDVTLTPDVISQPVIEEGWRPTVGVRSALRDLVGTLQGLADVGIWLALYLLPVALLIAIPVVILFWVGRVVLRWWAHRQPAGIQAGN